MAHGRTSTNAQASARVAQQLRLNDGIEHRLSGMTWQQIAEADGWSTRQSAHRAITRELVKRTEAVDHAGALQLELARLDALQKGLWEQATGSDGRGADDMAARTIIRIMQRRAKLLGLDDAERRMADAVEGVAGSVAVAADVVQAVLMAVLGRLDLTDEQAGTVPAIVVSVLEQHPALLSS